MTSTSDPHIPQLAPISRTPTAGVSSFKTSLKLALLGRKEKVAQTSDDRMVGFRAIYEITQEADIPFVQILIYRKSMTDEFFHLVEPWNIETAIRHGH